MEFRLYYRGPLKANGGPAHKQALRRAFHPQLRELWNQLPLSAFRRLLRPGEGTCMLTRAHGFTFATVVHHSVALVAELQVLLLRPEAPGAIVTQGGDIDNRIKTLLDALKAPIEPNAIPPGDEPQPGEEPFHVLLEDDALVTRVDVATDRLLDPSAASGDVVAVIRVRTKQLAVYLATVGLA